MYFIFQIAALFSSPYMRVKKRGNFKTNILVDSIESFLYCLSSSPFILRNDFVLNFKTNLESQCNVRIKAGNCISNYIRLIIRSKRIDYIQNIHNVLNKSQKYESRLELLKRVYRKMTNFPKFQTNLSETFAKLEIFVDIFD